MEGFLEKVGADSLEVVTEEIAEPEMLFVLEILAAFEQQPARVLEDRVAALAFHATGFLGADLVERLVNIGDDVEAVEDMQSLGASFADELQVRFPHVGTDEADFGDNLLAHGGKESLEGLDGPFLAHPEQTGDADIDLVDQRQIFVAFGVLDFVNADGVDLAQRPVLQSPGDDVLDSI